MALRALLPALGTAIIFALSGPATAQQSEYVSADVDVAIWCGAFYYFASQGAEQGSDDAKAYTDRARNAYEKARVALEADAIDPAEYDRIIAHYIELVVSDLSSENAELRYSEDECAALTAE